MTDIVEFEEPVPYPTSAPTEYSLDHFPAGLSSHKQATALILNKVRILERFLVKREVANHDRGYPSHDQFGDEGYWEKNWLVAPFVVDVQFDALSAGLSARARSSRTTDCAVYLPCSHIQVSQL